jgi:hypothetical protein
MKPETVITAATISEALRTTVQHWDLSSELPPSSTMEHPGTDHQYQRITFVPRSLATRDFAVEHSV